MEPSSSRTREDSTGPRDSGLWGRAKADIAAEPARKSWPASRRFSRSATACRRLRPSGRLAPLAVALLQVVELGSGQSQAVDELQDGPLILRR